METAYAVLYKDKCYLWYGTTVGGSAKLINEYGIKFTGTPMPDKLKIIKEFPSIAIEGHLYISTKKGIYSLSTGNKIVRRDLIDQVTSSLYVEETYHNKVKEA